MNGTIYDEIKKKGDSKKREKLKLVFALLSTNLLVALLCLSFGTNAPNIQTENLPAKKILHPHFKMIVVPLTLMVDLDPNAAENAISLMSKSKKMLISRAYLHEELKTPNKAMEGVGRFKIEIPEDEVLKLSADASEELIAIPELKLPVKLKSSPNKRVSHYEIDL